MDDRLYTSFGLLAFMTTLCKQYIIAVGSDTGPEIIDEKACFEKALVFAIL